MKVKQTNGAPLSQNNILSKQIIPHSTSQHKHIHPNIPISIYPSTSTLFSTKYKSNINNMGIRRKRKLWRLIYNWLDKHNLLLLIENIQSKSYDNHHKFPNYVSLK